MLAKRMYKAKTQKCEQEEGSLERKEEKKKERKGCKSFFFFFLNILIINI